MAFQKASSFARGVAPEVKSKPPVNLTSMFYEVRLKVPLPEAGGSSQFNSLLNKAVEIKMSVEFRAFSITTNRTTYHVPFENVVFWRQLKE